MKSILDKVNTKLNAEGGFLKAVSILAGGTAFAQILSVFLLPIITRLYTPEDFSTFAIFTSLLSSIVVISCLRFEIAIPLPQKDKTAVNLLILGIFSNIAITLLIVLLIYFFKEKILEYIKEPKFQYYIWLIPVSFFLSGLYNVFQFWSARKKLFTVISKTRIYQSISSSSIQIILGVLGAGALGLILGQISNFVAGLGLLVARFRKDQPFFLRKININSIKYDFKRYDNFPKFSTIEALSHSSSMHMPIVIIGLFLIGPEAGYILLAMKVLSIPMSVIGNAVAQVYLANAREYYNSKKLFEYSCNSVKNIIKISFLPVIIIAVFLHLFFDDIFGAEWLGAGELIVYILPLTYMQLIASPITMGLHVIEKQKLAMFLHILGFILRVLGLLIVAKTNSEYIFPFFIFSGFIFYFIYLIVALWVIYKNEVMN